MQRCNKFNFIIININNNSGVGKMHEKITPQSWGRSLGSGVLVPVSQLVHADISAKLFHDFYGGFAMVLSAPLNDQSFFAQG